MWDFCCSNQILPILSSSACRYIFLNSTQVSGQKDKKATGEAQNSFIITNLSRPLCWQLDESRIHSDIFTAAFPEHATLCELKSSSPALHMNSPCLCLRRAWLFGSLGWLSSPFLLLHQFLWISLSRCLSIFLLQICLTQGIKYLQSISVDPWAQKHCLLFLFPDVRAQDLWWLKLLAQ